MAGENDTSEDGRLVTAAVVHQWQCDHFGHLNVRNYAAIFDDALFIFWSRNGFVHGGGFAPVTADLHFIFLHEILAGSIVNVFASIRRIGTKSVTIGLLARDSASGQAMATCEAVEVFFDVNDKQSMAIPQAIRAQLDGWQAAPGEQPPSA